MPKYIDGPQTVEFVKIAREDVKTELQFPAHFECEGPDEYDYTRVRLEYSQEPFLRRSKDLSPHIWVLELRWESNMLHVRRFRVSAALKVPWLDHPWTPCTAEEFYETVISTAGLAEDLMRLQGLASAAQIKRHREG